VSASPARKPLAGASTVRGATTPRADVNDVVVAKFQGALGVSGGEAPAPTFVEVAFAGRSNVGKSSLINTLVQRKGLVRTSSTPGCTRQVNFFEIATRDGAQLVLTDLPGYGFARRSKDERRQWAELIEGYLTGRTTLRCVALLVDARRGLEEDDLELVGFVREARRPDAPPIELVVVATKLDKVPRSSAKSELSRLAREAGTRVVGFSSTTGEGRDELWRALRRALHLGPIAPGAGEAIGPAVGMAAAAADAPSDSTAD
jgi:GTP-binding protein